MTNQWTQAAIAVADTWIPLLLAEARSAVTLPLKDDCLVECLHLTCQRLQDAQCWLRSKDGIASDALYAMQRTTLHDTSPVWCAAFGYESSAMNAVCVQRARTWLQTMRDLFEHGRTPLSLLKDAADRVTYLDVTVVMSDQTLKTFVVPTVITTHTTRRKQETHIVSPRACPHLLSHLRIYGAPTRVHSVGLSDSLDGIEAKTSVSSVCYLSDGQI